MIPKNTIQNDEPRQIIDDFFQLTFSNAIEYVRYQSIKHDSEIQTLICPILDCIQMELCLCEKTHLQFAVIVFVEKEKNHFKIVILIK